MPALTFSARIKIVGVNPYVHVSAARAKQIHPGARKPVPVLVRVNGEPRKAWRINMMPVGMGAFYLYLHGDVRRASGTGVGDTVTVEVEFDTTYRSGPQHPTPASLRARLERNPKAKRAWEAVTPSRKKEVLRYLAGLKSEEALERNLEKIMNALSGKTEGFMGRHL